MVLKLGFVGFGPMASNHRIILELYPSLKSRVQIAAAFDPSPEAQTSMDKKGIIKANSFEDLLNVPGLNAVLIASPPQFHAQQAVAALESGKHVYSEVPMALKKEEIERIVHTEDRYPHLRYQMGENYCFMAEVMYAGQLAHSGKIGNVVYAESEYLHDVTYRWRRNQQGDANSPRINAWYSLFDPLAYAHSIGPAQVALGGIENPQEFVEVQSYGNQIGAMELENQLPICDPSYSFHVALFRTKTGAIAKCANAYVIAREPTRLSVQVIGKLGSYECSNLGKPGYQFIAKDHQINHKHRVGVKKKIGKLALARSLPKKWKNLNLSNVLILQDWIDAIERNSVPRLCAKIGANMTMAGIYSSQAARSNKILQIPSFRS